MGPRPDAAFDGLLLGKGVDPLSRTGLPKTPPSVGIPEGSQVREHLLGGRTPFHVIDGAPSRYVGPLMGAFGWGADHTCVRQSDARRTGWHRTLGTEIAHGILVETIERGDLGETRRRRRTS